MGIGQNIKDMWSGMTDEKLNEQGVDVSPVSMAMRTLSKSLSSSNDPDERGWGKTLEGYYSGKDFAQNFNFKKKLSNNYKASLIELNKVIDNPNIDYNSKLQEVQKIRSSLFKDSIASNVPNDLISKYDRALVLFSQDKMAALQQKEKIKQTIRTKISDNVLLNGGSAEEMDSLVNTLAEKYEKDPNEFELIMSGARREKEMSKKSEMEKRASEKEISTAYRQNIKEWDYGTIKKYVPPGKTMFGGQGEEDENSRTIREQFDEFKALAGEKWQNADITTITRSNYNQLIYDATKNLISEQKSVTSSGAGEESKAGKSSEFNKNIADVLTDQKDKAAYDWVLSHKSDPRSKQILIKLGEKYGF